MKQIDGVRVEIRDHENTGQVLALAGFRMCAARRVFQLADVAD
jgi:hypothetical protein